MTVTKTPNIIPIEYLAGSGGTFLSKFLTYAKLNRKELMEFSFNGNAHLVPYDDITADHILHSYSKQQLLNLRATGNSYAPYFLPVHYHSNLSIDDTVLGLFDRVIRITYDKSNIDDLVYTFIGKYHIDERNTNIPTLRAKRVILSNTAKFFLDRFNTNNNLDISWNDMLYNDIDGLLNKLSDYTNIDKYQFCVENLYNWRIKTLACIENVKYSIGDSNGIQ